MHMPGFNPPPQCAAFGQQPTLPHHLTELTRAHAFSQWLQQRLRRSVGLRLRVQ